MNALDLIAARLAQPVTHNVVTTYASGETRVHGERSEASANTFAMIERRKIGMKLLNRESGLPVKVVSVEVVTL